MSCTAQRWVTTTMHGASCVSFGRSRTSFFCPSSNESGNLAYFLPPPTSCTLRSDFAPHLLPFGWPFCQRSPLSRPFSNQGAALLLLALQRKREIHSKVLFVVSPSGVGERRGQNGRTPLTSLYYYVYYIVVVSHFGSQHFFIHIFDKIWKN